MNSVVASMLEVYKRESVEDCVQALREILQGIVLLGLWRGKFFERAAFYGGTALRMLHGLDRFSEDMDFSLLEVDGGFNLSRYVGFVKSELDAFGLPGELALKEKTGDSAVESAFLKANTRQHLLSIEVDESLVESVARNRTLRIKIEVDTDPPGGFSTETRYMLKPIPFSVRAFALPSLFAGKMHAVLFRSWKGRVKGRDWYDLVWYAGMETPLDLGHLESRMRQSGHYCEDTPLTARRFREELLQKIDALDVKKAADDVRRFLVDPDSIAVWSRDFFVDVARRIRCV